MHNTSKTSLDSNCICAQTYIPGTYVEPYFSITIGYNILAEVFYEID